MSKFQTFSSFKKSPEREETSSPEHVTPIAHSDNYKIVVVLDESGSMGCIKEDMKKALNGLILEQQQVKDRPCNFTLIKFNDKVHKVIVNKPLASIKPLSSEDYAPNGSTALFDAVGKTIDAFRYERDVLMVIITDGQENASTHYRKEKVMSMIKEKEQYAGWTYVYLSCDLNTAAQGDAIGCINSGTCTNHIAPQSHYGSYIETVSKAIKGYRTKGISVQSQLNSWTS